MAKLLIVGAGGHGKAVADAADCMGVWDEIGFADKKYPILTANGRWQVVGNQDSLRELREQFSHAVAAIGHSQTRLEVLDDLKSLGFELPVVRHPSTTIAVDVVVDEGSVILAGAVVNTGTRIGRGCIVNTGSCVDHDCILSNGVHICPGASLAGEVVLGESSWIGIGAVVIQQRKIGKGATVGAGSVVVRDVPDDVTVVGVPAKVMGGSQTQDEI